MIFSNILKTSFSRAVDVCSVSAGFSVEDIAVGCCFFTPLFITFHHKNNQNMVNFHHKHPISVHFFSVCEVENHHPSFRNNPWLPDWLPEVPVRDNWLHQFVAEAYDATVAVRGSRYRGASHGVMASPGTTEMVNV